MKNFVFKDKEVTINYPQSCLMAEKWEKYHPLDDIADYVFNEFVKRMDYNGLSCNMPVNKAFTFELPKNVKGLPVYSISPEHGQSISSYYIRVNLSERIQILVLPAFDVHGLKRVTERYADERALAYCVFSYCALIYLWKIDDTKDGIMWLRDLALAHSPETDEEYCTVYALFSGLSRIAECDYLHSFSISYLFKKYQFQTVCKWIEITSDKKKKRKLADVLTDIYDEIMEEPEMAASNGFDMLIDKYLNPEGENYNKYITKLFIKAMAEAGLPA